MLGLLPALKPNYNDVVTSCEAILLCEIDFNTLFRTLNLMQNLLLNNELTEEHPRALNIYAQSVLKIVSDEKSEMTRQDYKHLFTNLVFKLQLPVSGSASGHEHVCDACQICVNTLTDVFIQYTQSLNPEIKEDFEIFNQLWLVFMKVLLQYFQ